MCLNTCNVIHTRQLVPLPRQQTVSQVLDDFKVDFYKSQSRKVQRDGKAEEVITEVVEGLKLYFDRALGTLLLYKFERQQFLDLLTEKGDSLRMSDVYGAEHLLRLFGICFLRCFCVVGTRARKNSWLIITKQFNSLLSSLIPTWTRRL